jgi:hypothetical protein
MSRIARFAVLVASLMSLFAMMSATAGAVTWDNRGAANFTATNPATGTFVSSGGTIGCHNATLTGTAPNNVPGTTYTITGTVTYSPCFLNGITTTVACGYTFTTSAAGPVVFHGNLDVTCDVTQFSTRICHIGGQATAAYHNPEPAGVSGRLTVLHSNTLFVSNSGSHCLLGTSNNPMTVTGQTFSTTSANPPTLVRT